LAEALAADPGVDPVAAGVRLAAEAAPAVGGEVGSVEVASAAASVAGVAEPAAGRAIAPR
jgi:hypothetical protein